MSKDYARTRESRRRGRPANNAKAKTNFTWLVIGVVMGLIIAGLSFLKHRVAATVHPERKLVIDEPHAKKARNEKPAKAREAGSEQDKVNFDFYTILPNMKVKAPEEEKSVAKPPKPAVNEEEDDPSAGIDQVLKLKAEQIKAEKVEPARATEPVKSAKLDIPHPEEARALTPKEVQNMEQNLLSPTKAVKVDHATLKPVAAERPAKAAKPAHPAAKTETHVTVKGNHTAKDKVTHSKPNYQQEAKELAARIAQDEAAISSPAVSAHAKANAGTSASYIVQIAAFKRPEDAERLKAQLTLAGYDAQMKAVAVNGAVWHRVWVGTFPTAQAAEKVQKELLAKHTKGVVVKVK